MSASWRALLSLRRLSHPAASVPLFRLPTTTATSRAPGSLVLDGFPARLLTTPPKASPTSAISSPGREEKLFSKVDLEIRAHQPQVLKSYAWFVEEAAKHLDVRVVESEGEAEPHKLRKTLLKSNFVHSKHRVQYEFRTYFWIIRMEKLTESTRDTFLEYIQRNLPEGVAMKVTSKELMRLPKSIKDDIQERKKQ